MKYNVNSRVGDIVAADYRSAVVFKKNGIDFCCNGGRSLIEAASARDLDPNDILIELEELDKNGSKRLTDYKMIPADELIDYIIDTHHQFVQSRIREIIPFLDKVVAVHGSRHPELNQVRELFYKSAGDLGVHMKKEELILFPYIRKLAVAERSGSRNIEQPVFETVEQPIEMMHHEHDSEGKLHKQIALLTDNYTTPEDACNTYRVTYALLKEFEEDLHLHIHLENNILFPKAIEMESKLNIHA